MTYVPLARFLPVDRRVAVLPRRTRAYRLRVAFRPR